MLRIVIVILAWIGFVLPAEAKPKSSVFTESGTAAELVSDDRSLRPGNPIWIALRLKPKKGWHTYWRYAGDSGLATKIKWHLPPGFSAGPIEWPAPERITLEGLMTS